MARQSFIWTALPNGYTSDGASLRLSILLSPRLDPQAQPKTLQTFFPDWEDWPLTLSAAQFRVHYNGQTVDVDADDFTSAARVDVRFGKADSAAWKALFRKDLFVRPYAFQDMSDHDVLSYDSVAVAGIVEALYRDLARKAGDDLPVISDIVDDERWSALLSAIAEIDRGSIDRRTGLRNPAQQFDALPAPERKIASLRETLERFQLFHTPPATPRPRREARSDDSRIEAKWLEYQRTELPKKEDLAQDLDFHQRVAALGSYPTLLRRLGLVVDLLLPSGSFMPVADAALSVQAIFPAGTLQINRTTDAAPQTRTLLAADRFRAVSNSNAMLSIDDGLLDLDPARFRMLQLDVDGAGLKMMNFARSMYRRTEAETRVDSVTRHEDRIGVPALRTGGMTLVHRNRWSFLAGRFSDNKAGNGKLEDQFQGTGPGPSLHAEDLVRGYRIDIFDALTAKWRSLCQRTARYELASGGVVVEAEEEATVRLAGTKSSDPASHPRLIYLHEALVSWTGWSLAAPPPGRAIDPRDGVDTTRPESEAEAPPGLDFRSRYRPVKFSLPRLRFGRSYAIRARAVDLAGNSLDPQANAFGWERPDQLVQPYLRYEPVEAPVIALLSRAGVIEKPAAGESMARMAIRSFNDTLAGNSIATVQIAHRAAAPPRVSVRDAEQHGMFDGPGKLDAAAFNMLAYQKDVDPKDPGAAIRDASIPMQGPLDTAPVATTFAVYEAGRAITYLPDPLAREIAVRIVDHPNIASDEIIGVPLYPAGEWPDAQPFVIEAYEDATAKPYFDASARTLRVPMPKALRIRIRLSMMLASQALATMGVFQWLSESDKGLQRGRALTGQHWMLTPWREIEVVHAVQRPLLAPEITSVFVPRALNSTSARPVIQASCSIASTDRLDLLAQWHEPLDDAAVAESAAAPADRCRHDCAFHVKITDAMSYAQRLLGAGAGGFPDHTIVAQDAIGVNALGVFAMPGSKFPLPMVAKAHEFHDTRYRRIEYWFDATTRFREFLPQSLLTRSEAGQAVSTETHIKVTGPRAVAWVPNSAPPPAPDVLYVVPTFGWSRAVDAEGKVSIRREGGGLRVYLDRPWNASGYGEMLGVVLPAAAFAGNPDNEPAGHPYKDYVTQWGNDPVWDSPFVTGIAPRRTDFPRARNAPDATGTWLPPGAPDTEADQQPGAFTVTGLHPPRGTAVGAAVEVAPHDVFYDAERRLWCCDVEITAGAAYFPFIRLALARYQPISTPGAHLSNVVLSDIIALTADRSLNVTRTADPRTLHIVVFGARPYESAGHHEAVHSVAMSVIHPGGQIEELRPAAIAKTTVIEVWIERLDERLGEDFGWARVADASISGADPSLASPAPSAEMRRAVQSAFLAQASATERLQARTEPQPGVVDAMARGALLDTVTPWRTLWTGDATFPPAPGNRQRLVVAEYEEYLVDDDHPYDKVPTRKDRRLVFVEHLEVAG